MIYNRAEGLHNFTLIQVLLTKADTHFTIKADASTAIPHNSARAQMYFVYLKKK